MKLLCGEAEEEMTNCKENKATSQGLNVETRWWIRRSCPSWWRFQFYACLERLATWLGKSKKWQFCNDKVAWSSFSVLQLLQLLPFAARIRGWRSLLTQYTMHMSHAVLSAWSRRWNTAYALWEAGYAKSSLARQYVVTLFFLQISSMCSVKLRWLSYFTPDSFCEVICSVSLPLHVNLRFASGAFFYSRLPVNQLEKQNWEKSRLI